MRVAIIGNNDGPERLAAALAGGDHEVVLVAQQKGARPRVQRIIEDEQSLESALQHLDVDLIINCFANFRYRYLHRDHLILNVHLAPLPKYRGRHPLQWALINGEKTYGVTIHQINDDWDDGPIYWQQIIDVKEGWSAKELREHLFVHVEQNIDNLLDRLPTITPRKNDGDQGDYITRRGPGDSVIEDWTDREYVFRKVTALRHDQHPAYAFVDGYVVVFTAASRPDVPARPAEPGTVLSIDAEADGLHSLLVATGASQPIRVVIPASSYFPVIGDRFSFMP